MALGPAAADMTGKSVLITGGTKGLGLGCARVLVAAGANVHICGRDAEAGTRAAAELGVMGPGRCDFISADIGQLDDARELVHKAAARYGRLDCLINNAVLYPGLRAIESIPLELALETIRVNVLAYFVMSREALLYLRETHGTIIMMGSLAGTLGHWHDTVYSMTKGAVASLSRSLALEEARNGVRVNCILPGYVQSDASAKAIATSASPEALEQFLDGWQWMGRAGTPEEVGHAALFLASDMSSFCTGIDLIVSGGLEIGYGTKQPYPDFFGKPSET